MFTLALQINAEEELSLNAQIWELKHYCALKTQLWGDNCTITVDINFLHQYDDIMVEKMYV